jgi:hypothetical protein
MPDCARIVVASSYLVPIKIATRNETGMLKQDQNFDSATDPFGGCDFEKDSRVGRVKCGKIGCGISRFAARLLKVQIYPESASRSASKGVLKSSKKIVRVRRS